MQQTKDGAGAQEVTSSATMAMLGGPGAVAVINLLLLRFVPELAPIFNIITAVTMFGGLIGFVAMAVVGKNYQPPTK